VGFRWFVLRHARRLGLTGYVRNLADGRVEVAASGALEALARLELELRRGPDGAVVDGVDPIDDPHEITGAKFRIVNEL